MQLSRGEPDPSRPVRRVRGCPTPQKPAVSPTVPPANARGSGERSTSRRVRSGVGG